MFESWVYQKESILHLKSLRTQPQMLDIIWTNNKLVAVSNLESELMALAKAYYYSTKVAQNASTSKWRK